MLVTTYMPSSWYWLVGNQSGVVYSSKDFTYVALNDADYLTFLNAGKVPTSIDSDDSLRVVLNDAGIKYLNEDLPAIMLDRPSVTKARCRVSAGSFATVTASPTAATFNIENAGDDPLNMHNLVTNPERITIVQPGVYRVVAGARFLESSTGAGGTPNTGMRAVSVTVGLGGSPTTIGTFRVGASPADNTEIGFTEFFKANLNDVVRLFVEQRSGGSMNVQARLTLLREE